MMIQVARKGRLPTSLPEQTKTTRLQPQKKTTNIWKKIQINRQHAKNSKLTAENGQCTATLK